MTGSYKGPLRGSVALFKVAVSSVQNKLPIKEKLKDFVSAWLLGVHRFRTFTDTQMSNALDTSTYCVFLPYTCNQGYKQDAKCQGGEVAR